MRRGWAARSPRRCGGRWGEVDGQAARQRPDTARIKEQIALPLRRSPIAPKTGWMALPPGGEGLTDGWRRPKYRAVRGWSFKDGEM
jgi:hypothetical protein